jgi:DNA end-binding protein Ku
VTRIREASFAKQWWVSNRISIASESPKAKKPRKASAGQKEMLLPIERKKPAAKKAEKPERATGRRRAE